VKTEGNETDRQQHIWKSCSLGDPVISLLLHKNSIKTANFTENEKGNLTANFWLKKRETKNCLNHFGKAIDKFLL
jgi:hypothetical protein